MNYVIQFLAAMISTIAFAVIFSAPKRDLPFCGFTGALGWIIYFVMTKNGFGVVIASAIATFFLTVVARIFAVIKQKPATVYLLAGIFPLVPGAGIFYTAYYLFTNNPAISSKGVETVEVAGAIVFGIIFGFAIPQTILNKLPVFKRRQKK